MLNVSGLSTPPCRQVRQSLKRLDILRPAIGIAAVVDGIDANKDVAAPATSAYAQSQRQNTVLRAGTYVIGMPVCICSSLRSLGTAAPVVTTARQTSPDRSARCVCSRHPSMPTCARPHRVRADAVGRNRCATNSEPRLARWRLFVAESRPPESRTTGALRSARWRQPRPESSAPATVTAEYWERFPRFLLAFAGQKVQQPTESHLAHSTLALFTLLSGRTDFLAKYSIN